jgi:hypothetical protein
MSRRRASGQKFLGAASEPLAILKFDSAMSRSSVGNSGCAVHQQTSTKSLVEATSFNSLAHQAFRRKRREMELSVDCGIRCVRAIARVEAAPDPDRLTRSFDTKDGNPVYSGVECLTSTTVKPASHLGGNKGRYGHER